MFVFAFDRDWTVDVNPHPSHDAVPLEWVRHLAHDTPHAVYAIGNRIYTRINASSSISRVAEDFLDSVKHVTPTFMELLSDENLLVRESACWELGHLCARDVPPVLETRARGDDDVDVHTKESWALAQIHNGGQRDD